MYIFFKIFVLKEKLILFRAKEIEREKSGVNIFIFLFVTIFEKNKKK